MHFAAAAGSFNITQMLIDYGADLATKDNRHQTPIDVAIGHEELGRSETTQIIQLLRQRGQRPMQTLKTAIAQGNTRLARTIIEANPAIVVQSDDPGDLLLQAVIHYEEAGTTEIIKLLLENGAHPNTLSKAWPELPILRARTPDVAELLLASGADPNVSDSEGVTPLRKARKYKMKELEAVLLRYGATINPTKAPKSKGRTPKTRGTGKAEKKKGTKKDPKRD